MIGKLSGILIEKNPPQVLVDCQGVGYEVDVPMSTFYILPVTGEQVSLLTHFVVREDAQILYGFASHEERAAFRQLIKISGVGPRMALGLLSGLSVSELVQAVALQEAGRLVKIPGVGKKTADRLLLELQGK
ncbi:MAG: Holliday junction branch migration protein RuvA, partial [Betaproteobacteria bacterium]|nr:Holliday junction branch migration protein RuvA [Betaproteobacteria bacterium]